MKKALILMLGLVASSASFAQQPTDGNSDVVVESTNQKVQVYVAPQPVETTIRLVDQDGHTLFTQTSNAANGLRQKLDLSQLEPGAYRLTVAKDGHTIEKSILVEFLPAQKQVLLKA